GAYVTMVFDVGIAKLGEAASVDAELLPVSRSAEDTATLVPSSQPIAATAAAAEIRETIAAPLENLEAATLIQPSTANEEPAKVSPDNGDQATRMFQRARSTVAEARLTDLPLSNAGDTGLTRVGAILGTPLYMSPEQCRGEHLDARSDIYSLGIIAYQMLTGSPPFTGETTTIIRAHNESTPTPVRQLNKKLPKRVSRIVMSALE